MRQCFDQQALCGKHIGELHLISRYSPRLGKRLQQGRSLIQSDHGEMPILIGETSQSTLFSNACHPVGLHSSKVSVKSGIPARPLRRVHFRAAAADANSAADPVSAPAATAIAHAP